MGYTLQAFIGKQIDLESIVKRYSNASCIELGRDIAIIPMTADLYDEINQFVFSEDISTFKYLTKNIETQILDLIEARKVGYIEAEYFGGQGGQTAIIWEGGQNICLFEYGKDCINALLRKFAVVKDIGKDEFETLNLGRHRETGDWLTS